MRRLYYAFAALSFVVGALLWLGGPPFWWFGAGLTAAGITVAAWTGRDRLAELVDWAKIPRETWGIEWLPARVFTEGAAIVVMAGVAAVMLPQSFLGDRPVAHDHTVHYFKAWQLAHEFLAEGHLYGWSQEWFAGYPAQYLYPIGADLLVTGIYVATLGLIDFSTAYAWAICLFWFIGGYAVYRFGVGAIGRWGALLAAFLFMTDTAANRIGGWYFAIEWGVWPMSLATVLAVWAMAKVPDVMEGKDWRILAGFGGLMAASLITHPFMLIHFTIALAVALLGYWFADTDRHWVVGTTRLAGASVVGALMAAVWVLPFMSHSSFMDPGFGGRWTTMARLGEGIYNLDFLPGTWALLIGFGLVGMIALLTSRRFERLLCGLLCLVFIVFGTCDFLASFHALEFFPSLHRVHFKRFITLLKPYWMVAAAYGAVAVVRYTWRHAVSWAPVGDEMSVAAGHSVLKRWARVVFVVMALAPMAIPFGHTFGTKHLRRGIQNASERPHQTSRDRLVAWFDNEYPDGEPFFRIATKLRRHDHQFVDLASRLSFPVYKLGYMPATAFNYRFESGDPELLEALNVRYVVSLGGPPAGEFEKVEQFGALSLYEFKDWSPEPFEVIEGGGEVTVEEFGDEEIVLQAAPGSKGRLRLNVSYFERWHAYRDGEPIDIDETSLVNEDHTAFMTVDLEPGEYRFVFRRGWPEWVGYLLFLLGLVVAGGLVWADIEGRTGQWIRRRLVGAQRGIEQFCRGHRTLLDGLGMAAVLGVLAVGFGMAWAWPPLHARTTTLTEDTEQVHYDFGDRLRHASVRVVDKGAIERTCRPRLGRHICGDPLWKQVHQRLEDFGPDHSMVRCIWAHPVPEGPLEIVYTGVPRGEAVAGYFGVPETGTASASRPVRFEVGIDGRVRHQETSEHSKSLASFRVSEGVEGGGEGPMQVTFRISAEHTGKRHFCFNAQVVELDDDS